ncbi:hypothetical protein HYV91_03645 [Candidatus Wolfebacteria bacterium]|nr:hypothetical protein [Candidatus Wolfebacteria bacterium]
MKKASLILAVFLGIVLIGWGTNSVQAQTESDIDPIVAQALQDKLNQLKEVVNQLKAQQAQVTAPQAVQAPEAPRAPMTVEDLLTLELSLKTLKLALLQAELNAQNPVWLAQNKEVLATGLSNMKSRLLAINASLPQMAAEINTLGSVLAKAPASVSRAPIAPIQEEIAMAEVESENPLVAESSAIEETPAVKEDSKELAQTASTIGGKRIWAQVAVGIGIILAIAAFYGMRRKKRNVPRVTQMVKPQPLVPVEFPETERKTA